jgi:Galactose oxidase, central domain
MAVSDPTAARPPARARLIVLVALAMTGLAASEAMAAEGWRPTAALASGRAYHTATPLPDGRLLVAGGLVADATPTGSTESYDPAAERWSPAQSMAVARVGHTASRLEGPGCVSGSPPSSCGKVLVVGGSASAQGELYDPAARSWSPVGSLATARAFHTATVLANGKVLIAGGETTAPGPPSRLASAELYDPATGSFAPTAGSLDDARRDHSATLLSDGSVLVAGGRGSDLSPLGSAELYDPSNDGWTSAGSLAIARFDHTATFLGDGRVLVAGGDTTFSGPRRSAEIYDQSASGGPWIAGASMAVGRARSTATVLPGGRVLLAGGAGLSGTLASAENYLVASGIWEAAGSMAEARERHTATLLAGPDCGANCGRVLVAGGLLQGTRFLASAALYGPLPVHPSPLPPARGVVTNLSARAVSARRVRLTFSAPGSGGRSNSPTAGYVVRQSTRPITAGTFPSARSLCGGVCSFSPRRVGDRLALTVTALTPRRTYHYALRARGPAGDLGPLSNPARARTLRDRIRPGRVTGLSATRVARRTIRLRFRASASDRRAGPPVRRYVIKQSTRPIDGARGFKRARSLCTRSCRFAPLRVGARLRLSVTKLCLGATYYYAIRALDEGGNLGPRSRSVAVRTRRAGGGGRACLT